MKKKKANHQIVLKHSLFIILIIVLILIIVVFFFLILIIVVFFLILLFLFLFLIVIIFKFTVFTTVVGVFHEHQLVDCQLAVVLACLDVCLGLADVLLLDLDHLIRAAGTAVRLEQVVVQLNERVPPHKLVKQLVRLLLVSGNVQRCATQHTNNQIKQQ